MRRTSAAVVALIAIALIAASYIVGTHLPSLGGFYSHSIFGSEDKNSPDPIARAVYTFTHSDDPAERTAQVVVLKKQYIATTSPSTRAQIIDILIGFSHSAHEPYIFSEIFKGEPFSDRLDSSSEQQSLADLAEYSFSLYPTAFAAQMAARPYALELDRLVRYPETPQTQPALKAAFDQLMLRYKRAEDTIEKNLAETTSSVDKTATMVAYYQWQGHLLLDAAKYDRSYFKQGLDNLSKGIALGEEYDKNNNSSLLEQHIAAMMYTYASQVFGPRTDDEVVHAQGRAYADALADKLISHPEQYNEFYILFREVRDMPEEMRMDDMPAEDPHVEFMREIAERIRSVAELSPKLENLLAQQGLRY